MSKDKKTKSEGFLGAITTDLDTKGQFKNTLIETGKDLGVGVVGGGAVGAVLGKWSLVIGTLVTGIGHYAKSRLTSAFGLGMMSSGVATQMGLGAAGNKTFIEGAKERLKLFKDGLSEKLFLDKLKKKNPAAEGNNAVGEVQYFSYGDNMQGMNGEVSVAQHIDALNKIEQELTQGASQMKGVLDEENALSQWRENAKMEGVNEEQDMGEVDDVTSKNY